MRVLVTGGAGRIGSFITKLLSERDHFVRVFDLPFVDYSRVSSLKNVELFKGDITVIDQVKKAVRGVDAILHLAAILPPGSEKNRDRTIKINVGGTENICESAIETNKNAQIVLASSVSVYGDTHGENPPIKINHPIMGSDFYSESKVRSERMVRESGLQYTILRVAGISTAEPFEFPEIMQYREDQRVEFIDRDDVALAFVSSVEKLRSKNEIFNIAGGETWQMIGGEYVNKLCEAIGMFTEVNYPEDFGWVDWYDTNKSQEILKYQKTSFEEFQKKIGDVFKRFFG
jgi:nucleoside-diphosphate-sugar epimerase